MKNKRTQTTNIRDKIVYHYRSYNDPIVIKRVIREYYQQLYSHKSDTLEEIDQYLKKYKVTKLNQNKIDHLNSIITTKEIEFVI